MRTNRVTVAFVFDADGRLKGILTMDRLTRAEKVAQQGFPSVSQDIPAEQTLFLVAEGNVPVAVLDGKQRLLG